jgi:DNA-binding CsgD family transcriptional regulator
MASFTPTEQRILDVLADGMPHTREELAACLWDELAERSTIKFHISKMRSRLQAQGTTIVCELGFARKFYYRHVRLLTR